MGEGDRASADRCHDGPASTCRPTLLRAVALKRAKEMGGRPSVSGILVGLVRQHQDELENEAGRYLELLDLL